ncbi:MAG: alanine--glyoxylate aminotransferase family protein [Deferribacteres bacterium]|nr:alanine--glyoxylate aminotransferase family protein [Deferribacteres bacterium]
MKKNYLFSPGPTPVPPEVSLAMAQPILHHRTNQFTEVFEEAREGLKYVFQTERDVLILASSGTGAMEAAVANLFSPGEKAVCVRGGKFGERWAEICESYGVVPVNIDVEWGEAVKVEDVAKALDENPDVKAVLWQASETSTGVKHPTEELAALCRERGVLSVVDGITAVGVFDVKTDDWGLDVVVSGSQKAFMLPPGLAFITLSERAWEAAEGSKCPRYYFDLKKELKNQQKGQTAYTPAVSLIIGLRESLKLIKDEGLENVFKRHALLARATREAMKAIGLELFSKSPSEAVTAVKVPPGIDGAKIPKLLRDKYGVVIAGGQAKLKGKIFRLSHMGYVTRFDMVLAISAVEGILKELGYSFELGAGVKRAQEILWEE